MARRKAGADEILVATLGRVPLAGGAAAGKAWLAMLGEQRRKLKLIEIDGLDVGMAELDGADVQIRRHEQARIARARGCVDACARFRRGARIGARPATEPGRDHLGRTIGAERRRTKSLLAQRS